MIRRKAQKAARQTNKKFSVLKPSHAAVAMLARAFEMPAGEVAHLIQIPADKLPTASGLAATGSWVADMLARIAKGSGMIAGRKDSRDKEFWCKEETTYDEALGVMMRNSVFLAHIRAEKSSSIELLVWAISDVLQGMKRLPSLLQQFEHIADPGEFSPDDPDTFQCGLVEALVDLLGYFEDECERHPARFRLLARELPHWPFLVTQHRAGYRKRFEQIAGKSFVSLGTECPLDTSPQAMYRLQTPVCGLLWEEVFKNWINVSAGVRAVRRSARERNHVPDVEKEKEEIRAALQICCNSVGERKIFRQSFNLPDLNKSTARRWADKFVIPLLHLRFPDWKNVPAFSKLIGKKGGDTRAEKEIRRAVEAMARR